jgi:phosphate transport system protein
VNLHTSTEFERELQSIKALVSEMGALAQFMIEGAIEGFENADIALLKRISESEKRVDQLELEIDALCNHVLAVRQPTAVDMRLVVASLKIVREIERVGDEAEKIARISLSFHQHPDSIKIRYRVLQMSKTVRGMLAKTLQAYQAETAGGLQRIRSQDLEVDHQFRDMLRLLILLMIEDKRTITPAIDILFIAKALERIGDHAKNIAEQIAYIAEGTY